MVEWARLESVCAGNRTEGSNPSLSAIFSPSAHVGAKGSNDRRVGERSETTNHYSHGRRAMHSSWIERSEVNPYLSAILI